MLLPTALSASCRSLLKLFKLFLRLVLELGKDQVFYAPCCHTRTEVFTYLPCTQLLLHEPQQLTFVFLIQSGKDGFPVGSVLYLLQTIQYLIHLLGYVTTIYHSFLVKEFSLMHSFVASPILDVCLH